MTKIERASQNVNLAIEAVAEAARELSANAVKLERSPRQWTVSIEDMTDVRIAIEKWDTATAALLRLYGKPEAHAPEGEEGDAPVPA